MTNHRRLILALSDEDLESFVFDWMKSKLTIYKEVARFSGSGDLGRDVVGFLSHSRHEGEWHNYQCKQYGRTLTKDIALLEIGKILYYTHLGEFVAPVNYFFVAPRGLNGTLQKLIYNPTAFKDLLIKEWNTYCAKKICQNKTISLNENLLKMIQDFDFANIKHISIDDILNDEFIRPALHKWFGADPGPAPKEKMPFEIQDYELPYIKQLTEAYEEREGRSFSNNNAVTMDPIVGSHFARQRERFHDAIAFKRFYRDNTDHEIIDSLENDIYHGVIETYDAPQADALGRIDAVMIQASKVVVGGPLANHARVPVKQGICHHFANELKFKWKKDE